MSGGLQTHSYGAGYSAQPAARRPVLGDTKDARLPRGRRLTTPTCVGRALLLASIFLATLPACRRSRPTAPTSTSTTLSLNGGAAQDGDALDAGTAVDEQSSPDASVITMEPPWPPPVPVEDRPSYPRPEQRTGERITADQWLSAHGISHWNRDATCWTRVPGLPEKFAWGNDCSCHQRVTLTAPTAADFMICQRGREINEPGIPAIDHTVVYVAEHGKLRPVLDVPTAASSDDELTAAAVGEVRLGVTSGGEYLEIFDDAAIDGYPCQRAVALAQHAGLTGVAQVYGTVCASIGKWRWTGSRLVRQK